MSQEHGDYDPSQQKWFCGYWLSHEEWLDIHDYAPAAQKESDEGEQEDQV